MEENAQQLSKNEFEALETEMNENATPLEYGYFELTQTVNDGGFKVAKVAMNKATIIEGLENSSVSKFYADNNGLKSTLIAVL